MPVVVVPLPVWAMVLMIGMPAVSILLSVVLAWYTVRATNASHEETAKILHDITARTQVIIAQNRDVLRRLDDFTP